MKMCLLDTNGQVSFRNQINLLSLSISYKSANLLHREKEKEKGKALTSNF